MNNRQKEVEKQLLQNEKDVLKSLEKNYASALLDIKQNIKILQSNPMTQSKTYQLEFQKQLESKISKIVETLHNGNYTSVADYLNASYTDGFIGAMYDIQGQGVPLVIPLDQDQMIKAVSKTGDDYKLSSKLGVSTKKLKEQVQSEISRGFARQLSYKDIARNISNYGQADLNRSLLIARTEGHRIQNAAKLDADARAKEKGADIVKQWDSTLDGNTRPTHRVLDGQIKELDEKFTAEGKAADYPGGFGDPAEDCNCRCTVLQRAKWAIKDESSFQKMNNESGKIIECSGYNDFKDKYLNVTKNSGNIINVSTDSKTFEEFKNYFSKKYGVTVQDEISKLNLQAVTESASGIEKVLDDFPKAQKQFTGLKVSESGIMACDGSGKISYNPGCYKTYKDAKIASDSSNGFHPKNTGVIDNGSHEAGHILELSLIENNPKYVYPFQKMLAFQDCDEAKSVVSEACARAKKTPEGKGLISGQLINQVSGYALKDRSECMAEAISDYYCNGDKAALLSKQIYAVLKERLK